MDSENELIQQMKQQKECIEKILLVLAQLQDELAMLIRKHTQQASYISDVVINKVLDIEILIVDLKKLVNDGKNK